MGWIVVLLGVVEPSSAQPVPRGDAFQVNTYADSWQMQNHVAPLAGGGFAVVWTSNGSPRGDVSGTSIQGRLYEADGAPVGDQFQVNEASWPFGQDGASVVSGIDGSVMIAFLSESPVQVALARRYAADGTPLGLEKRVSVEPLILGSAYSTSVAGLRDGGYVVAWNGRGESGNLQTIRARRLDGEGVAFGDEVAVSEGLEGHSDTPVVTASADGGFLVIWRTKLPPNHVYGRHFSASGRASSPPIQLSVRSGSQFPDVLALPDGGFVAAWRNPDGLWARRLGPLGTPMSAPFEIGSPETPEATDPSLATGRDGGFLVSYGDGSGDHVWIRGFDAAGGPTGPARVVAQTSAPPQLVVEPLLATNADGVTLATWARALSGGDFDIDARFYIDGHVFEDGFESGDTAAWSETVP